MINFTNITNDFAGVNTLSGLLGTVNNHAWVGLMIMMQFIIFIAFLPFGFISALITSAFIILISGMFLVYLELMAWHWLMLFLGQILFIIMYITWEERVK